jgi:hypothetical protein
MTVLIFMLLPSKLQAKKASSLKRPERLWGAPSLSFSGYHWSFVLE